MKANELMIGDWVYFTLGGTNDPVKVTINEFAEEVTNGTHPFFVFEPIPLTEEILKANGFKNSGKDNEFVLDGSFRIFRSHLGYFFSFVCEKSAHFKYVHELQHALRLCGLNELADNFKLPQHG